MTLRGPVIYPNVYGRPRVRARALCEQHRPPPLPRCADLRARGRFRAPFRAQKHLRFLCGPFPGRVPPLAEAPHRTEAARGALPVARPSRCPCMPPWRLAVCFPGRFPRMFQHVVSSHFPSYFPLWFLVVSLVLPCIFHCVSLVISLTNMYSLHFPLHFPFCFPCIFPCAFLVIFLAFFHCVSLVVCITISFYIFPRMFLAFSLVCSLQFPLHSRCPATAAARSQNNYVFTLTYCTISTPNYAFSNKLCAATAPRRENL